MGDQEAIAEALQFVARDLESRNYRYLGVIRQAQRFFATALPEDVDGEPCERCGRAKPEPGTAGGRPRKFCELCSPPRVLRNTA